MSDKITTQCHHMISSWKSINELKIKSISHQNTNVDRSFNQDEWMRQHVCVLWMCLLRGHIHVVIAVCVLLNVSMVMDLYKYWNNLNYVQKSHFSTMHIYVCSYSANLATTVECDTRSTMRIQEYEYVHLVNKRK